MDGWRIARFGCLEGDDTIVGGLAVWRHEWRPVTHDTVWIDDPIYPGGRHGLQVYEIGETAAPVRFAAGELSNGVWGFCEPCTP